MLLKRTRAKMTGNYLGSEATVKELLKSCRDVLQFAIEHRLEKKLFEVKMLCRSILMRCQKNFSELEEYVELKRYVDSQ